MPDLHFTAPQPLKGAPREVNIVNDARRRVLSQLCGASFCVLAGHVGAAFFPNSSGTSAVPAGCGVNDMVGVGEIENVRMLERSGVLEVDQNVRSEVELLNKLFSVKPQFMFYDDGGAPQALAVRSERGARILLGVRLIRQEIALNPANWQNAIIGIMAHEWAHAFQYDSSLQEHVHALETHADYMAGWYLGVKKRAMGMNIDPAPFARSLYLKGTTAGYFDPDKHGTATERTNAMVAGFDFAASICTPDCKEDINYVAKQAFERVKRGDFH